MIRKSHSCKLRHGPASRMAERDGWGFALFMLNVYLGNEFRTNPNPGPNSLQDFRSFP